MKNKIICIALCVVALAASILLLTSIINRDDIVINIPDKKEENPTVNLPPVSPDGEKVELSTNGVSAFAQRIEDFVERLAYKEDKSFAEETKFIVDNSKAVADWLEENGSVNEAGYYRLIADGLDRVSKGITTDIELSAFASRLLKDLRESASGLTSAETVSLYPALDTEVGGSLTLALISINDNAVISAQDKAATFTVTVGGGALLGDRIGTAQEKSFKNAHDNSSYGFPFYKLSPFFMNDDASFITLLAPLTESAEPSEDILDPVKGLPLYAESLKGIDFASISPSEILDYGQAGYDDTVKALSDNGITYSVQEGSAFNDTAFGKVVYITFDLTDTEVSIAQKDKNCDVISAAVNSERENGADLIVVQLHWNTRLRKSTAFSADYLGTVTSPYEQHFDAFNKEIGRAAIRAGADLVVGTGAHVLQGIELYRDRYIVYSSGNLTYSGSLDSEQANTAYSFLFRQTFVKENGENKVLSTRIIPVVNNSLDSPLCPTPVFDERADDIVEMLTYQSSYFADAIKEFNYVKIAE